jgi:glycosyltransferase involved in cell wall biosynthesis
MRRLAFDLRTRHLTGIYRYGSSLLACLYGQLSGTGIKLYVLYRPDIQKQVDETLRPTILDDHVEFVLVPDDGGRIPHSLWLRNWLIGEKIRLYYTVDFLVDIRCPTPFVYTSHDLIPLKYPEYFYNDNTFCDKFGRTEFQHLKGDLRRIRSSIIGKYRYQQKKGILPAYAWAINRYLTERSKHIVTVSESVKADLVGYLGVSPSKVSVIPGAVDRTLFYPQSSEEIATAAQKFDLPQRYCLCIGRELKHKRLPWLIEALAQCQEGLPPDVKMVVVGSRTELGHLRDLVNSYHLEQRVIFTGRVDDQELASLYSGASALIVPSIDEGFCLPALEALSCGTEVIVPDTRVFRETVSLSGHFYAVNDGRMLIKLLLETFDGSLIPRSHSFENRFSWSSSAQQLLKLLMRLS